MSPLNWLHIVLMHVFTHGFLSFCSYLYIYVFAKCVTISYHVFFFTSDHIVAWPIIHSLYILFADAPVQLQCGAGNVISSATTNSAGLFSILLDPLQFLLSSLLTNCNLVVNTPLSTCNSGLPSSGALLSPLRLIGNTLQGPLHITNIIPANFVFLPHL